MIRACIAVPIVLGLTGCASIHPEFEAARDAALAEPGPPPDDWEPDGIVRLSAKALDDLVVGLLERHGTLKTKLDLGLVQVVPKLTVTALTVRGGEDCTDCLAMDAELEGTVRWSSALGSGKTSLDATTHFDAVFAASSVDGIWTITAQPKRIRDITVTAGDTSVVPGLDAALRPWIDEALTQVSATPIATVGSSELPFRAVRVVPDKRTVQLQVLTTATSSATVPTEGQRPQSGFFVDLDPQALVALARTASFQAGPVDFDVTPDPQTLEVQGDAFTLGLRLWRTTGRGWWRDVRIAGTLGVRKGELQLTPQSVEEVAQSKGAVFVDPIAALAEGVIWRTLAEVLDTSLPAKATEEVGGLRTRVRLTSVEGVDGRLHGAGVVEWLPQTPSEDGTVPKKGKDRRRRSQ